MKAGSPGNPPENKLPRSAWKFFLGHLAFGLVILLAGPASAYNHPELNWRVIETGHFRILYHQGEEVMAREGSRVAEEIYPRVTGYYGYEPAGKTVIIFQDTDDYAYGESSYFQSAILITATSLDLPLRGRADWLKNVITHEFTHLVSLKLADRFGPHLPLLIFSILESGSGEGRPRVFHYLDLAGSFPIPGSISPSWFSEGIAQLGSTRFGSDTWDNYRDTFLRASWLADQVLSLDEMGILSGKDAWEAELVYNQGFSFCRFLEERYGPEMSGKLAAEQGRGWHWNFGNTIKQVLGRDLPAVYAEWLAWLSEGYREELEGIAENEIAGEKFAGKGRLNLSPRFSPDGEWIAYVSSDRSDFMAESLLIVPREKGGNPIFVAGGVNSGASYAPDGRSLLYSREDLFDWRGNHFSDLYVYDLAERSETKITDGLRAFNPAWSPDGTRIAFINNEGGDRNVWLLDLTRDEAELKPLTQFSGGAQLFSPAFSPAGDRIAFGILDRGNEEIYSVDLSGKVHPLVSGPANERDPAWVDESHLLYSSDQGGIFNLYLLDLASGERKQLTRVKTGAFMPVPDPQGKGIVYSYFTAEGFRINWLSLDSSRDKLSIVNSLSPIVNRQSSIVNLLSPIVNRQSSIVNSLSPIVNRQLLIVNSLSPIVNRQSSIVNSLSPIVNRQSSIVNSLSPIVNRQSSIVNFTYPLPVTGIDHPYHFSLLPVAVFPEFIYEDEQGFKGGAIVMASDLLGKHTLMGEFLFGENQDYTVQYLNSMWHPTFYLEGGYYIRNLRWEEKRKEVENSYDLKTKWSNFQVGPQYIFQDSFLVSPFYRFRVLNTEGLKDEYHFDSGQLFQYAYLPLRQERQQAGLILWHLQFSPTKDWGAHPRGGRQVLFIYSAGFSNFNREVEDVIETGNGESNRFYNDYRYHQLFLDWTENFALPLDSALETSLSLGWINRDVYFWDEFFAGGSMEFTGMGEFRTRSDFPGFPAFHLRGERLGIFHLSYRLPVLGIKKQVGFFYFNRVYFSIFGDAGNVIQSVRGFRHLLDPDDIKIDAGCEIRLSSNIFYSYPWGTFIRLAHGFPDPEKEPVRVYVGIGTGF
ncbi:MAG: DPP IV N-terminal domain-containing protein [Proteobacteria bacterium]|nr:DPP IV N-terminal domain-containing protein [Pseudomonadota bacterium]